MFSKYKLDDLSVDIFSRAMFTKVDKDSSNILELYDVKLLLKNLYQSFNQDIDITDEMALSFLKSNGIYNDYVNLDQFSNSIKNTLGVNSYEEKGYPLIKKDKDVVNLTFSIN